MPPGSSSPSCPPSLILGALARTAEAGAFDPKAHWRTIESPHFLRHHPERIADIAQRATNILEEIYPKITEKWDWETRGKSDVVLTDSSDDSNGLTSVLPYNWMLIYLAPPSPDSSLGHYDNWLRELLLHEFTHLVQIDANAGAWRAIRVLFGKTVAPSGIDPTWMREGMSQYDETIFTDAGRGRGSFSEMVVRTAVLEDAFPTIDVADGLSWRWPSYRTAYIYGIKFVQWLIETYGEDRFLQFDKRVRSSLMLAMINHQARNVYGKTFYELWNEWRAELALRYAAKQAELEARGVTKPAEIVVPSKRDGQYSAPTLCWTASASSTRRSRRTGSRSSKLPISRPARRGCCSGGWMRSSSPSAPTGSSSSMLRWGATRATTTTTTSGSTTSVARRGGPRSRGSPPVPARAIRSSIARAMPCSSSARTRGPTG